MEVPQLKMKTIGGGVMKLVIDQLLLLKDNLQQSLTWMLEMIQLVKAMKLLILIS